MNGLRAPRGGNFNAGDEAQPKQTCTMFRLLETGHRVVVGERQDFDAGRGRVRHQFARSQ